MEPTKTEIEPVLTVWSLRDGGYMVRVTPEPSGNGMFNPPIFACSTMQELTTYIRKHLGWQKKR